MGWKTVWRRWFSLVGGLQPGPWWKMVVVGVRGYSGVFGGAGGGAKALVGCGMREKGSGTSEGPGVMGGVVPGGTLGAPNWRSGLGVTAGWRC